METIALNQEKALAAQHENRPWGEYPRVDEKPDAPAIAAARQTLRTIIKPGATVYTAIEGRATGSLRYLRFFVVDGGRIRNITGTVAHATGQRAHDRDGVWTIKNTDCGMDGGFHEVYSLGRALYPNGFKTTTRAPPRNGATVGTWDNDGGYALRQEWL